MSDKNDIDEGRIAETRTSHNMADPVDSMNITKFYANHAAVNISLFEIRLIMSFVNGTNPQAPSHLLALESMLLSMSPELAYATHALLGKALENYNKTYGPIRKIDQGFTLKKVEASKSIRDAADMKDVLSEEVKE